MGQGWAQPTMVRGSVDKGVWHQAEGVGASVSLKTGPGPHRATLS